MRHPRSHVFGILAGLILLASAQAHEFRMGTSLTYAENFSRTSFTPTAQDAKLVDVDAAYVHAKQLSPGWNLITAAEGNAEHVSEFRTMSRLSAGGRATLRHKFGLGPMVPVLDLGAALTAVRYRESGRSGWKQEGFATLSQRLTEVWRVAATASWESFSASHAPFDTHARRLGFETFYDLTDRWQISAGASRMHGQLVANATWSVWGSALGGVFGPTIQEYYSSVPWEVSDTFDAGWVAYRVECRADFWWAQLMARIDDRTSIPLRYESVKVVNRVGVRYDSAFWSLGVLRRF